MFSRKCLRDQSTPILGSRIHTQLRRKKFNNLFKLIVYVNYVQTQQKKIFQN